MTVFRSIGIFLVLLIAWIASSGCASTAAVEESLILISLDGFRWDYIDGQMTPNLARLASEGVRSEGLIPVYPSKTFPSLYSIATGLYPGNHGIISNNMYDREMDEEFHLSDRTAVEDPRWWGGEPIWVTAEKQGLPTATMFWAGSEAAIDGVQPRFWRRFDTSVTFEERVEQVLQWLDLPTEERPRLVALYFEEPNETSHKYGPDSPENRQAIRLVDARVGDLVEGLRRRGLEDHVNLIIVSDHGFAETSPDRVVVLDQFVELMEGEVLESGAILQIFPKAGRRALIYSALKGAHPHLSIYLAEEIPDRYHLKQSPRVPPILGVPEVGWEVGTKQGFEALQGDFILGDHGQDPEDPRLHGIFLANGPAFRSGVTLERFENVEIYNLLASVLDLHPAPNDGTPGRLSSILDR